MIITKGSTASVVGCLFLGFSASWAQQPAPAASASPIYIPKAVPVAPAIPSSAPSAENAASPPVLASSAGDYTLSVSDTLSMSIFQEPDLATRGRIASDGTVQLPLLGEVKVAGMTIRQARDLITRLYDADYLVRPQVYLSVAGFAERKFTVLGQVAKPGTYEITGGESLSLLQAVGLAGGFTRLADHGKVTVERVTGGETRRMKIDGRKLTDEEGNAFKVSPGDVITVRESWF